MSRVGETTLSRGSLKRDKKDEKFSFGTLGRKKKTTQQLEQEAEDEAIEVEVEGADALDSSVIPLAATVQSLILEEVSGLGCDLKCSIIGEEKRLLTAESRDDPRVREIIQLLIHWLNEELADQRIVVKHIQEDLYDGQIIQKLIEKLANIKIEVPEVSQSEEGQRQKLHIVIETVNRIIAQGQYEQTRWNAENIHNKDIVAIMQLLIAIAIHFRAPVRFPEYVNAQVLVVQKKDNQLNTRFVTEQLTTTQTELGVKGERDAFDTLFDYGPDKLAHVKSSLLAFCNKHLNKINLEVTELETQFQDGVYLVLLMGLLEGYFVPLYSFHLQVSSYEQKVHNVAFAYRLMAEAGVQRPRARVQDIANGDLKSTLRVLHSLFTKYKHVSSYEQKVHNVAFAYRLMAEAGVQRPRARVQDIANGDLKSTLRVLHSLFTKYKHV
ncbi:Paralyzed arrest at two-fold protein 6 [Toxocara canis]|uniref:Paralyzed arrest at two-fold protein 6 n=1 Tax=Toxocara canis TaxID=6265 RepID=A0A0B2V2E8_TOXCA|nr:Paralyzed arrest at two-fold protein 6 [Toxocara canis]